MSRTKRWAGVAAAGVVFVSAVIMGLWFMGILSLGEKGGNEAKAAERSESQSREWEIVFKGMKLTIPEKGEACIHESGCMNVRQQDDYLIQIDIEDDIIENMWARMDSKKKSLTESGYRIDKEPEWISGEGQEYICYVISMADERGSDFERSYFEVMLMPADAGRHFLAVARFDGIDIDGLDTKTRDFIYKEALEATLDMLAGAESTDERDDETGTFWMEDPNIEPNQSYISEDSIFCKDEKWVVTYQLPESSQIISDNIAGKTYLDTDNRIYIRVSITNYTWETAQEKAQKLAADVLSRIHAQGENKVNGRTFYYYTYSVLEYGKKKKQTHYYFHAFCDLENGDIYSIYGSADDCPMVLSEMYYLDVMNITESNIWQK